MRKLLMGCKYIILLCLLGTGILIAGSSFEILNNIGEPGVEIQSGQNSHAQKASMVPQSFDHTNIILVLLGTGLIGFIGVRRHGHAFTDYVRAKPPQHKFDEGNRMQQ